MDLLLRTVVWLEPALSRSQLVLRQKVDHCPGALMEVSKYGQLAVGLDNSVAVFDMGKRSLLLCCTLGVRALTSW
jgi:hypothetical protein